MLCLATAVLLVHVLANSNKLAKRNRIQHWSTWWLHSNGVTNPNSNWAGASCETGLRWPGFPSIQVESGPNFKCQWKRDFGSGSSVLCSISMLTLLKLVFASFTFGFVHQLQAAENTRGLVMEHIFHSGLDGSMILYTILACFVTNWNQASYYKKRLGHLKYRLEIIVPWCRPISILLQFCGQNICDYFWWTVISLFLSSQTKTDK